MCGYGLESEELIVTYASVPGQMPVLQTTTEQCDIKIKWTLPSDRGEEIQQIRVQVLSKDGEFYPLSVCED